jgi:cytochrome c-550 PedF
MKISRISPALFATLFAALAALAFAGAALAHGNVTPQAVDTSTVQPVGEKWLDQNPYRGNAAAIKLGSSAYGQNCARCHGLEAISGGIAPDLRMLDRDCMPQKDAAKKDACFKENDQYFLTSVRHGKVRNGAVYMPPFEGIFNQEAMWSIKAYLESVRDVPVAKK